LNPFGRSPAVLEAYLGIKNPLSTGILSAKIREQIALAVAKTNTCDYCLAAHSLNARSAGRSTDEIADARRIQVSEPKTNALLKFATAVVESRGLTSDDTFAAMRSAGATDAEIVAHVVLRPVFFVFITVRSARRLRLPGDSIMNTHCCSKPRSRGPQPYRRPLGTSLRWHFAVAFNRARRRFQPHTPSAQPQLPNSHLS